MGRHFPVSQFMSSFPVRLDDVLSPNQKIFASPARTLRFSNGAERDYVSEAPGVQQAARAPRRNRRGCPPKC